MTLPPGALPPGALQAALAARAHALIDRPTPTVLSDEALMRETLEAAAPLIAARAAAAERERIRQLAVNCGAVYTKPGTGPFDWIRFADLLEDPL